MTGRTQLSVDLIARVGGFEAGMKRAAGAASSASSRIRDTVGSLGPAVGASLLAVAAVATAAVKQAIDRADEISKLSQKIGISTEALSRLSVAAELSDVSVQQLQGGIMRLVRAQQDVAEGAEGVSGLFNAIGVSAVNADGSLRQTDKVLRDLADVFASMPDGAEKTALAVDLFGRSGANLIPLLNEGSAGLREMDELSDRLGTTLTTSTGRAAEGFNDNLTLLRLQVQGLATQVAAELLPDMERLTGEFTAAGPRAEEVADGIRSVAEVVSTFASGVVSAVAVVQDLTTALLALWDVYRGGQQAILAASPVGQIMDLVNGTDSLGAAQARIDRGVSEVRGIEWGRDSRPTGAASTPAVDFITPENLDTAGKPPPQITAAMEALAAYRAEQDKARQGSAALANAERAAAEATRDAAKADAERQRALEQVGAARDDFRIQIEDYQALLDGPLAEAELQWERRQQQLEDMAARGQISARELADGLDVLAEARQRDVDAINAQLTPAQQVIADLETERAMLGMSNTEREIANALRYAGVDAMSAEGVQIAENIRLLQEARERIQFDDDIRRGFEDTFASIIDGSKSAKDALADLGSYITSLIAQRLSEQLVDSLFGKPGKPGTPLGSGGGGGGIGDLFSSALSALFGGGRAAGGWVSPGKMYEVAENGPELLRVGNRQFLLPTATGGMVTPNSRMGRGGSVTQNITVAGRMDNRTASQLAAEASRAQRRVTARFG